MKTKSFVQFVGPSVVLMVLLLAVPLLTTFYLSVRNCAMEMEMVKIEESTPFGVRETLTQKAKLDAAGRAIQNCSFVGLDYYKKVLGLDASVDTVVDQPDGAKATAPGGKPEEKAGNEFLGALKFTMIYTFVTLPFVAPVTASGRRSRLHRQKKMAVFH